MTELKGEIDRCKIVVGNFNTTFSTMDRTARQKINKELEDLNTTTNQLVLTEIHKAFHPTTAEHTFFSSGHRTFSRTDHMLGYKTRVKKFRKIEMKQKIFSDHSEVKLEISIRRKTRKLSNMR